MTDAGAVTDTVVDSIARSAAGGMMVLTSGSGTGTGSVSVAVAPADSVAAIVAVCVSATDNERVTVRVRVGASVCVGVAVRVVDRVRVIDVVPVRREAVPDADGVAAVREPVSVRPDTVGERVRCDSVAVRVGVGGSVTVVDRVAVPVRVSCDRDVVGDSVPFDTLGVAVGVPREAERVTVRPDRLKLGDSDALRDAERVEVGVGGSVAVGVALTVRPLRDDDADGVRETVGVAPVLDTVAAVLVLVADGDHVVDGVLVAVAPVTVRVIDGVRRVTDGVLVDDAVLVGVGGTLSVRLGVAVGVSVYAASFAVQDVVKVALQEALRLPTQPAGSPMTAPFTKPNRPAAFAAAAVMMVAPVLPGKPLAAQTLSANSPDRPAVHTYALTAPRRIFSSAPATRWPVHCCRSGSTDSTHGA